MKTYLILQKIPCIVLQEYIKKVQPPSYKYSKRYTVL